MTNMLHENVVYFTIFVVTKVFNRRFDLVGTYLELIEVMEKT